MSLSFHSESLNFLLPQKTLLKRWLTQVAADEGKRVGELSFIFCTDDYLLNLNRTYLAHDYYTDVITFDYSEANTISGDVFISLHTVLANATTYAATPEDELHRVMLHGVLHLCGYPDATPDQQQQMRAKENHYLQTLNQNPIKLLPLKSVLSPASSKESTNYTN
jgi:rRNA maturation RNase YbeY